MVLGSTEIYIETDIDVPEKPSMSYEFRGNAHYLSDVFGVPASVLSKIDNLLQSKNVYAEISSHNDGVHITAAAENKLQPQLRKDLKRILAEFKRRGLVRMFKVGSRSEVIKKSPKKRRRSTSPKKRRRSKSKKRRRSSSPKKRRRSKSKKRRRRGSR